MSASLLKHQNPSEAPQNVSGETNELHTHTHLLKDPRFGLFTLYISYISFCYIFHILSKAKPQAKSHTANLNVTISDIRTFIRVCVCLDFTSLNRRSHSLTSGRLAVTLTLPNHWNFQERQSSIKGVKSKTSGPWIVRSLQIHFDKTFSIGLLVAQLGHDLLRMRREKGFSWQVRSAAQQEAV